MIEHLSSMSMLYWYGYEIRKSTLDPKATLNMIIEHGVRQTIFGDERRGAKPAKKFFIFFNFFLDILIPCAKLQLVLSVIEFSFTNQEATNEVFKNSR